MVAYAYLTIGTSDQAFQADPFSPPWNAETLSQSVMAWNIRNPLECHTPRLTHAVFQTEEQLNEDNIRVYSALHDCVCPLTEYPEWYTTRVSASSWELSSPMTVL